MSAYEVPVDLRGENLFHHIDMGFLNRRLCLTTLPRDVRTYYIQRAKPSFDHMTLLGNDHLLVTILIDVCNAVRAPTLLEAVALGNPKHLFRSTERLSPCPEIYEAKRVSQDVELSIDFGKPVRVTYHTEHIVSSTGKMTLAQGSYGGNFELIIGFLRDKGDRFEIEPLVMGAPWFEHPRNDQHHLLDELGLDFGEILPEDIDQFSKMASVEVESAAEWLNAMKEIPERAVRMYSQSSSTSRPRRIGAGKPTTIFRATSRSGASGPAQLSSSRGRPSFVK